MKLKQWSTVVANSAGKGRQKVTAVSTGRGLRVPCNPDFKESRTQPKAENPVYGLQKPSTGGDTPPGPVVQIPNDEVSYTATCPFGYSGTPVTVTIAAGTFQSPIPGRADRLALLSAQAQADALLVCQSDELGPRLHLADFAGLSVAFLGGEYAEVTETELSAEEASVSIAFQSSSYDEAPPNDAASNMVQFSGGEYFLAQIVAEPQDDAGDTQVEFVDGSYLLVVVTEEVGDAGDTQVEFVDGDYVQVVIPEELDEEEANTQIEFVDGDYVQTIEAADPQIDEGSLLLEFVDGSYDLA